MRAPYEKPTILRQAVGMMNKFGRPAAVVPLGSIDGVPVRDLLARWGSPLWVVSEGTLRRRCREMQRAFALRYPRVQLAYSYKTNYLSGVCAILHREGAWAEVVSGFEYEIARSLGVPGDRIVFNGPLKTREELATALELGSRVNVDSYDELFQIEELAEGRGRPVDIGLRVNVEVNYPPWDRFGFNYESAQAFEACKRAVASGCIRVVGLHCHVGTYVNDTRVYTTATEKLVYLAGLLQTELGIKLEYVDLGGGYASRNTLQSAWVPGEQSCPTFDEYAEAICPALLRGHWKPGDLPRLILEPGRALVDEAMSLAATVVSVKRLRNGEKGVVIDAGVNVLPTAWWYRHDVVAAQEGGTMAEDVHLYGPLCMQIDCLRQSVSLPPLRRGDALVIKNVGAYNFTQSMQFIHFRPAVVLITDGRVELLRRREDTAYVKELERVPDHLRS
ncbi:MAG: alanine racemase [Planctomycetes bacterium]|nr:alanine racemase [Planctomycetota bacterium]